MLGNPTIGQRARRFGGALLVIVALVGMLSTVVRAFPVGGKAWGVFIDNVTLPLGAPDNFGPTPLAEQPPGGGTDSDSSGSVSVSGGPLNLTSVFSAGSITVSTTGNPANNTSTSTATVNNLSLLSTVFGATSVTATCSLTNAGFTGSVSFGSPSTSVAGLPLSSFSAPGPNTLIQVSGLGTLILNEQVYSDVGGMRVFSVNAYRLTFNAPLLASGSITIGHAECSGSLPVVTSVLPGTGATGTSVTITGSNYLAPASVTVGGLPATNVVVVNDTTITATVPAALPQGPWDVIVTTPIGSGKGVNAFTSTNTNPPVPVGGSAFGTESTILLAPFAADPSVNVPVSTTPADVSDSAAAVNLVGVAPLPVGLLNVGAFNVHTVTSPAAGTVTSTATSGDGVTIAGGLLSAASIESECHYGPGGFTGNATLDGLGSSLLGDLNGLANPPVNFGLNIAGLGQVTLNEQIDATAGGIRTFTVNAIHVNVAPLGLSLGEIILGQTTCATVVPTAISMTPVTGTTAGGTLVTVTGTNFSLPASLTFDGVPATNVTLNGATQLTALTPAHIAGTVPVIVSTPSGSANVPGGFTYVNVGAPTATTMVPNSGTTAGGTSVVIGGTNFVAPMTVTFDGVSATTMTINNQAQVTVTTPAHVAGNVPVVITTQGGTTSVSGGYTYVPPSAPTAATITPTSGTTDGGTSTTIIGTNFTGTTSVTFGGVAAASFTVDGPTQITAVTPAHAAGNVAVVINAPGGTASVPGGFTFVTPNTAPTGSSITPAMGPTTGGTSTTITGTNFTGTTSVTFGGTAAASFTVDNATQITALTPAHAAGNVAVQITSPGGSGTVPGGFTFVNAGPADIGVTGTGPVSVSPGAQLVYAIRLTNSGSSTASNVSLAVPSIPGASAPLLSGGGCITSPCSLNVLSGGTVDVTATYSVPTSYAGSNPISATFTATLAGDPTPADNTLTINTPVVPMADISLLMSVDHPSSAVGTFVVFTLTATNTGPANATGIEIIDKLPIGLTLTDVSQTGGAYVPETGRWSIGSLASGASVSLLLTARVDQAGAITNIAIKTAGDQIDPDSSDNIAVATINGQPTADVRIGMTASSTSVPLGGSVNFTINVRNVGPASATGLVVTDLLPVQLTYGTQAISAGVYNQLTGVWNIGTLAPNTEAVLVIATTVNALGPITNKADKAAQNESDPSPNSDHASVTINGTGADLQLVMTSTPAPAPPGAVVTVDLTLTNLGPDGATGVIVSNALPGGLIFVSASAEQGTYDSNTNIWTVGTMPPSGPDGEARLRLLGTVPGGGVTTTPAIADGNEPDPNLLNNSSGPLPPSTGPVDLAASLAMTGDLTAAGTPVTYTMGIANIGTGPSVGTIDLRLQLPANVSINSSPAGWTCLQSGQTYGCSRSDLKIQPTQQIFAMAGAVVTSAGSNATSTTFTIEYGPDVNLANNVVSALPPGKTCPGDSDCDGMTDDCETKFGLDLTKDDSQLDPDGDGLTNIQECTDGTHPRGFYKRIYAEGATGSFFSTEFSVVNTDSTNTAKMLIRALLPSGAVAPKYLQLDPMHRQQINASEIIGPGSAEFATTIESDVPFASARAMAWDPSDYGMSLGVGAPGAATTWYFAEGSTLGDFQLFFLLVNPSPTADAHVTSTYLLLDGSTVVRPVTVPAHSRVTVGVKAIPGLNNTDVGAIFTSDLPVVVERSMYLNHGRVFEAGDAVTGVPAPATNWFIAEGANSAFFTYFLLLANPGSQPTTVTIRYQLEDGTTITKLHTLPATSRKTINVGLEDPQLASAAVSTSLTATNPIIAERAMWWPGESISPRWYGGHQTMGATETATRWAIASGSDGGTGHDKTFVLISNQNASPATAKLTIIFDDATFSEKLLTLGPTSRTTVNIGEIPGTENRNFSVIVESIGGGAVPLSVDVSRYRSQPNQFWAAGGSSLGTPVP